MINITQDIERLLLVSLKSYKPVLWINKKLSEISDTNEHPSLSYEDIIEAEERLKRFAPLLRRLFPETLEQSGIIESRLANLDNFKEEFLKELHANFHGRLFLKCDNELPVAGSIKARGGIYEVLKYAEELAFQSKRLSIGDNYEVLMDESFKEFFGRYTLAVGSTGNLGLSIGIMGAALGFNVNVHMSADAKEWKKILLKGKGVNVFEYSSDYSKAVEEGRKKSDADPFSYFIDDENSKTLFLGYSTAALRLKKQLEQEGIIVDEQHPLFVYIPCGVGGAPGGICFGLKKVFGSYVHCFFVEPTHSPCMLLGMASGLHEGICVQDIGLDNKTEADGLAVGRPSGFVGKMMEGLLSGVYTVEDNQMFKLLATLRDSEGIIVEPSATPGLLGAAKISLTDEGREYLRANGLEGYMKASTHIAWATGGSFVPEEMMESFYKRGKGIKESISI